MESAPTADGDVTLAAADLPEQTVSSPRARAEELAQAQSNNCKMRKEVKAYLSDTFAADLVTVDYVNLFLRNRAKNIHRDRYTIRGETQDVIKEFPIEQVLRNPVSLIRLLISLYQRDCEELISSLDIYTLPSFNLNNLDDMLRKQLEENAAKMTEGMGKLSEVGAGLTGLGGDAKDDDIDVDAVFEKWDKNGSKLLEENEFFGAIKELAAQGIDFDVNDDGDINEEVDALFDYLDEDDDNYISYEEFRAFVEEQRAREDREAMDAFMVFDWHPIFGPFVFVFAYILYGMSIITQFMIPTMITLSYLHGQLGEDNAKYKFYLMQPEGTGPFSISNFPDNYEDDMLANAKYWESFCPNTEDWDIKLSGMMLFIFLLVATPVADLVNSIWEGGEDEQFYLIKHSRFCEDTFFKKTAPVINLLCFGTILVTTYLLFMSAPQVDQLLLNVIAVNFLIEVDNICITTVIDDKVRERMVAKMVMWYICEGEKSEEEMGQTDFYYPKLILGTLFGKVAGWVGIAIYSLSWFMPLLVYACM